MLNSLMLDSWPSSAFYEVYSVLFILHKMCTITHILPISARLGVLNMQNVCARKYLN